MLGVEPRAAATASDEGSLWRALRAEGSASVRERLFAIHLPFARALAGRQFRGRRGTDVEYEDLLQLACTGLLEAIDRFDPGMGVPFKGFAVRRIKGAMIDGVAKMSEVREQISFRNRVRKDRARSLAGDEAGSARRGEAMAALVDMAVGLALGFMLEGTLLYRKDADAVVPPTAYESVAWKDLVQRVTDEVARLPERERRLIELHYLEDVNFDQIATLFGVTKGRISQLHKAAVLLLRKRISAVAGFHLER